jgi:hypothetical protein
MRNTLGICALTLLFCACTTTIVSPQTSLKEATQQQVSGCTLIRNITVTSPFYGVFAGSALQASRDNLVREAEASGATHIVFGQSEAGYGATTQHAQAFACK